jgi:serine/threonine-protein kinase
LLLLGLVDTPDGSRDATLAAAAATVTISASGFASPDPDATVTQSTLAKEVAGWPTIPGYQIVEQLGEGGGGRVFKAHQLKAGRRVVAVKVLHGLSRVERERLAREARSMGKLDHPNIVTIFEVGETPEGPYFTMEYLPGGSLADRIRAMPLDPMESARIVEGVAQGVAAAHARKILHRDLKPSNVLLDADGTPKVSDFGLAKFADSTDPTTLECVTPTGAVVGTPAYMAPEQAAGRHDEFDERTDIYGLGAVLYHCLTGRPPFKGHANVETLHRVLRDEIVPPRSLRREISPGLEAVCLKCLERNPGRRYAAAEELRAELTCIRNGEPPRVRPLGLAGRGRRKLKRNRRAAATIAGVLTIVAATWLAMAILKPPTRDPVVEGRNQLAAALKGTEPVFLIGNSGGPKMWWRWQEGAVPFAESMYQDGAFAFQSLDTSRLELVPAELLPPAFILDFEARHEANRHQDSAVGVYFNDEIWETGPDYQARDWYQVSWNDFRQPADPKTNPDPASKSIACRLVATRQSPGDFAQSVSRNIGTHRVHVEPDGAPRPWRRIRIVATPDRLLVQLIERDQESKFGTMPRDLESLQAASRMLADQLFPGRERQMNANIPRWGPSGSLGLMVERGIGSFRNVVITPLPSP